MGARTYRSQQQALACAAVSAFMLLCAAFFVWLAATDDDLPSRWPYFVAMECLVLLPAWIAARCARSAIVVDRDEVVVRNPFRTQRLSCADVKAVTLGRSGIFGMIAVLQLKDGNQLAAFGVQASGLDRDREETAALIDELNARVASGARESAAAPVR
jgi:hypothetical protein